MAGLMILNPRPATRRRATSKRRRKMSKLQLKYFGPRRAGKSAARKAAPARRRKARAGGRKTKPEVVIVTQNPRGKAAVAKKRKHHRRRKAVFAKNPRRTRRYRRNPRIPGASLFNNSIVPAAIGAAGALGVDVLMASVPMPMQFRNGAFVPVVKIGVALLIGAAVGAMINREAGEEAAAGGIVVTLYGMARNFMLRRMPSVPLARYVPMGRNVRPAMPARALARYVPMNGIQAQLPGNMTGGLSGLGWASPARVGSGTAPRAQMRYLATR